MGCFTVQHDNPVWLGVVRQSARDQYPYFSVTPVIVSFFSFFSAGRIGSFADKNQVKTRLFLFPPKRDNETLVAFLKRC